MKTQAKDNPGTVIDLDDGLPVPAWIWVDVEQGFVEAFNVPVLPDQDGVARTYTAKGRFRHVPATKQSKNRVRQGANRCPCGSSMTVPGGELCIMCFARDRRTRFPTKLSDPFHDHKCELCSRQAAWSVSDEVQVSPVAVLPSAVGIKTNRRGVLLFDRGATVGHRYYCDFHYRAPRVLDERGEVMETDESAGGVRPQWHS
ncbi:MAG: hypothetical protein KGL39_25625 [Patescibacteria group bacterium]|nr:hypothetical protein [Patescibacteria group bacterium]